jgi:hypothetical protein
MKGRNWDFEISTAGVHRTGNTATKKAIFCFNGRDPTLNRSFRSST